MKQCKCKTRTEREQLIWALKDLLKLAESNDTVDCYEILNAKRLLASVSGEHND